MSFKCSKYSGISVVNVTFVILRAALRVTAHSQYSSCSWRLPSARFQRSSCEGIVARSVAGNATHETIGRGAEAGVFFCVGS